MLTSFMSYLGSQFSPGVAGNQLWALIYILIIFAGVSVAVIAMNWIERKALAHFQVRLGPMRVGPHGLLQPFADALKLLLKEDIIPAEADQVVFWIAPLIGLLAALRDRPSESICDGKVAPPGSTRGHGMTEARQPADRLCGDNAIPFRLRSDRDSC